VRRDLYAYLNYAVGYGIAKERPGIGAGELQFATREDSAGKTRTATEVVAISEEQRSTSPLATSWIKTQFSIFEVGWPENLQATARMSEAFSYSG
jgi:hypothetical protein